jgi:hypothetical protein
VAERGGGSVANAAQYDTYLSLRDIGCEKGPFYISFSIRNDHFGF